MKYLFETARLGFRKFELTDFDNILALDSDPEVMRYLSDGKPSTPEHVTATLKRVINRYDEFPDMGAYITEVKSTGEFIGWHSLKPLPGTNEIEIGYRLIKKAWGYGYATEGAKFFVQRGFQDLKLAKIVGITHPGNNNSKHVLQKAGLIYVGERPHTFPGEETMTVSWFEASNPYGKK